ncbi:hypothetical protein N7478_009567 [Penicillium angulare]|uniref:uncharacterized protein n=1 Tax=Penicillium angulare TaxID=116970 RepID=UPI0025414729|nr:uncharacterized protein N7478_009567 [Penicillium angulare]KAJ5266759.1 hypothetical protein N7478_009567 [Penicillium angulare]
MDTIRPGHFSDLNTIGRKTGTREDLAGRDFVTRCPPDLPPRHRVLALLGICDTHNMAHPSEDGWFVSDFYLFHHLLEPKFPRSPNQLWLTCEDPAALVAKYGEFLHGDSKGDRRVVLDNAILPAIVGSGNIRVCPRQDLLERYLSTLREQANEAARLGEHLLLFIFGHGKPDFSLEVAQSSLELKDFRRILPPNLSVTIFMTPCYSGGWLVIPDFPQKLLNATAVTAAGPKAMSFSWPKSSTLQRSSGSLVASAFLRCLIDIEEDSERQEIEHHPTYIKLAKSIYDCVKTMGIQGRESEISFSAENDEWEQSYQSRLGLPLTEYKAKWESLRHVASSGYSSPESPVTGCSGSRAQKRLVNLAKEYLAANPGQHNASPNLALHGNLHRVLKGEQLPKEKVDRLTEETAYRLASMHEADFLREQAGIKYPSIFDLDTNALIANRATDSQLSLKTWQLLVAKKINTEPIGIRGGYHKGPQYLTLALVETCGSWDQINQHILDMASKKKSWYKFIFQAWNVNRVANDERVMMARHAVLEALKKIGK